MGHILAAPADGDGVVGGLLALMILVVIVGGGLALVLILTDIVTVSPRTRSVALKVGTVVLLVVITWVFVAWAIEASG